MKHKHQALVQIFSQEHGLVMEYHKDIVSSLKFKDLDLQTVEIIAEANFKRECICKITIREHIWYYYIQEDGLPYYVKLDSEIKSEEPSISLRNIRKFTHSMVTTERHENYEHQTNKVVYFWSEYGLWRIRCSKKYSYYKLEAFRNHDGKLIQSLRYHNIQSLKKYLAKNIY